MEKKSKKGLAIAYGTLLTAIGLMVIPPIIVSGANKKYVSKKENLDIENMGPKIVKKNQDGK